MSAASRAREHERRFQEWTTFRAAQSAACAMLMESNEYLPVTNIVGGVTFTGLAADHRAQQETAWLMGGPLPLPLNDFTND